MKQEGGRTIKRIIVFTLVILLSISLTGYTGKVSGETKDTLTAAIETATDEKRTQEKSDSDSGTVQVVFDTKMIDEALQGMWTYVDTNIGSTEVLCFDNGAFSFTNTLDAAPDNPYTSSGEYTIYEGYISIYFPKTDYTNNMNYCWLGEELVIYEYIDSGADKGNTRVYVKQDTTVSGSNSLPSTGSANSKPTYSNPTTGMRNALKSAKEYLSVMPFSYSGLIEQLEFEGYSNEEATYAAENCGADWKKQAVQCAQNYLSVMSFSRSGLIEQLEFDGFTHEQAIYGVDKAY